MKNECLRPYYLFRMSAGVWSILNRRAIRAYERYCREKSFPKSYTQIVQDLKTYGIAITSLEELGFSAEILERLQRYTDEKRPLATINAKKTFWLKLWETVPALDFSNPFVSVCLSTNILDVVNGYLGLFAKFYYYSLHVTLPMTPGEAPRNSQNWHRDPEDKRMCKFFIYLNDVDEKSGPFMYVQGSQFGGKWRSLYPQRPPAGRYADPGGVEAIVPPEDIRTCIGKAGTVIFADTSGLHKGGYATEHERVMFMAGYITHASPRGVFYTYGAGAIDELERINDPGRFAALGNRLDATGEMH